MWVIISEDLTNNRHFHIFENEKDARSKAQAYFDKGFKYMSIISSSGLSSGSFCIIKGMPVSISREIIFHY